MTACRMTNRVAARVAGTALQGHELMDKTFVVQQANATADSDQHRSRQCRETRDLGDRPLGENQATVPRKTTMATAALAPPIIRSALSHPPAEPT